MNGRADTLVRRKRIPELDAASDPFQRALIEGRVLQLRCGRLLVASGNSRRQAQVVCQRFAERGTRTLDEMGLKTLAGYLTGDC